MSPPPKLTLSVLAVLDVLQESTIDNPAWGLQICEITGLGSGTVYPILDRFAKAGWVSSWDEAEPHPGRPARRYWAMSAAGLEATKQALDARCQRQALRLRTAPGAL